MRLGERGKRGQCCVSRGGAPILDSADSTDVPLAGEEVNRARQVAGSGEEMGVGVVSYSSL